MARYKVRLDDGSEIVLELQAVKDWYTQGLLTRDSPVLKPGASQWLPLARALQLVGSSTAPAAPAPRSSPAPARRPRRRGPGGRPALRLVLTLAFAVAAAWGAWQLLGAWILTPKLQATEAAPQAQLTLEQIRAQSVETLRREVPLFSAASADRLVRLSEAQGLPPEEAFRRGFRLAALGVSALTASEAREMTALTSAAYAHLGARERALIASYLEKLKSGRATSQPEDQEASAAMKRALQSLAAPRLGRIQDLYAKAIEAGLARD